MMITVLLFFFSYSTYYRLFHSSSWSPMRQKRRNAKRDWDGEETSREYLLLVTWMPPLISRQPFSPSPVVSASHMEVWELTKLLAFLTILHLSSITRERERETTGRKSNASCNIIFIIAQHVSWAALMRDKREKYIPPTDSISWRASFSHYITVCRTDNLNVFWTN